jgi:hypothetical protein
MAKKIEPSRVAAALQYLQQMRDRAADFGGGVVENLADRARSVGGLAYEALATDPNMGRMTTAEYAQAADRPTPRLDQAAQDLGTIGKAIVTQPVQTGKALVQGEVERARQAMTSPRAAGEYAGSMVDPMRIAAALRKTAPIAELDVYHGTPHRFPETEANPLGEFDASKIGTGEGAQAFGHGIYLAESPSVAQHYSTGGGGFVPVQGKDNVYFNGQWVQDFSDKKSPEGLAKYAMSQSSTGTTIKEKTETLNKIGRKDAADWLEKNADKFNQSKGNLYTADLPDEMIDRMLDWEKPLSEQSEFVKAAIRAMPNAPDESKWKNWTGEYLYRIHLQRGGRESPEKPLKVTASEKLQNASIPGIKYLDAGSRSRGLSATGTRNFVVFPGEEKKVRILERK